MAEFYACVRGYGQRHEADVTLAVMTGYYSGYYNRAKRPKSPAKILDQMHKHTKTRKQRTLLVPDIETFEAREKKFQENLSLLRRGD